MIRFLVVGLDLRMTHDVQDSLELSGDALKPELGALMPVPVPLELARREHRPFAERWLWVVEEPVDRQSRRGFEMCVEYDEFELVVHELLTCDD